MLRLVEVDIPCLSQQVLVVGHICVDGVRLVERTIQGEGVGLEVEEGDLA